MSSKPNIVYILNDHQAFYRHSMDYGVQRPRFDAFAASGANFPNTYTVCPLCGPARRTMLTGLYPHHHRELHNDDDHPYDTEVYLDLLAGAGYRNYYYGKWHAGPGTALDHGCAGMNYPSYNNPYTKPEYEAYLERYHLPRPSVRIERSFRETLHPGDIHVQDGKWCNEHATGVMLSPKETHEAFFLAALACERLDELAKSPDSGPFSLRVDFWGPHQPYFPTQEYLDLYDPASIPEYGSFRDDLHGKPDVYRTEMNAGISEKDRLLTPNPLPWSEWQKVLQKCYAQITMMDEAAGRILDKLRETGLDQNTLVIWTTDHGDAVACHGGHFDKRSYLPEEMLRIPLAMRFPGRVKPGTVITQPVSNIDMAPTMLDAAGLRFDRPVDGESLLPVAERPETQKEAFIVSETYGHMEDCFGRAIRDGRWKYVYTRGQLEELYDLEQDPFELENLAGDPRYDAELVRMKRALMDWKRRTGDDELEEISLKSNYTF